MSKTLATIETNAPIEVSVDDLTYSGPNMEEVVEIWKELSFKTLIREIRLSLQKNTKLRNRFQDCWKKLTLSILNRSNGRSFRNV